MKKQASKTKKPTASMRFVLSRCAKARAKAKKTK